MRVTLGWLGRKGATAFGFGMILAALGGSALAGGLFATEIDPGSMAGALTLLMGGMLMITGRRRRQRIVASRPLPGRARSRIGP